MIDMDMNALVDEAYQKGAIEGYRRGREDAAGFRDCGITDKDEMRDLTGRLAQRPGLESSKDLNTEEAGAVIEALRFAKESDNPADLIRKAAQ